MRPAPAREKGAAHPPNNIEAGFSTEVTTAGGVTYLLDHFTFYDGVASVYREVNSVREIDGLVPLLVEGHIAFRTPYCTATLAVGDYGVAIRVQSNAQLKSASSISTINFA